MDKSYIKPGKDYVLMQNFEVQISIDVQDENVDDAMLELYIKDMLQGGPLPVKVLEVIVEEV